MVQLAHDLQLVLGVLEAFLVSVYFGGVKLTIFDLLDKVHCSETSLS